MVSALVALVWPALPLDAQQSEPTAGDDGGRGRMVAAVDGLTETVARFRVEDGAS